MTNYKLLEYCPECGIGINTREAQLRHCQNCKANWTDIEEVIDDITPKEFKNIYNWESIKHRGV